MFIEELKLTLFKGFREFTLACSPFTCLVGLNSQGKTSILQAIRLLHDIITFAFGNRDHPDFANPQWRSNPSQVINRLASGDPDAIWLNKKTSDTCKIAARYTGNIEVFLEISGRNNYDLDIRVADISIKDTISDSANRQAITDISLLRPAYLPPVGAVSPTEDLLHHPQLTQQMDTGRDSECWRSRLWWLWNDGERASFDQLVQLVQQYLPDAKILPPRLTHNQPPKVLIEFQEGETKFDISTSGGGLRTLLNLAMVLHFSSARCILCDEPALIFMDLSRAPLPVCFWISPLRTIVKCLLQRMRRISLPRPPLKVLSGLIAHSERDGDAVKSAVYCPISAPSRRQTPYVPMARTRYFSSKARWTAPCWEGYSDWLAE